VLWITTTIASFFAAAAFWTPFIASRFGSIRETGNAVLWVTAVFGSWMIILIPLIVVMYSKVDKAYEDARIRREEAAQRFQSQSLSRSERLLSEALIAKVRTFPETIKGGHLMNARLRDGRSISNLFISRGEEILGIYDQPSLSFRPGDILDLDPVDMSNPPFFLPSKWLRLDGASYEASPKV